MTEVFIENQKADISDVFSALISYAIDDIKDFGAKNTSVSKSFIMPGSANNNKLFGNIFDVNVSNYFNPDKNNIGINFNAALSARVYVFQDNFQVMKGVMQLLEVTIDNGIIEYEVAFFGELTGFVAKMGSSKLEDLDFSEYDHEYNITNITSSWSNSSGTGYFYPLIDYGNYSTDKHNWDFRTFRPALFAREYIQKIFKMAGYIYDFDLLETSDFKKIIVPHNQKKLISYGTLLANALVAESGRTVGIKIPIDTLTTSTDFILSGGGLLYTGTTSRYLNISFKGNGVTDVPEDLKMELRLNGSVILNFFIPAATVGTPYVFDLSLNNVYFNTSDLLEIYSTYVTPTFSIYTLDIMAIEININSQEPVTVDVSLFDNVQINYSIPKNYLQKDFISSILKMFNMYLFEDRYTDKLIRIKPFIDFYSEAISIDWTDKIDRSKPIKIKPMSELNSRYYQFNYKDDTDYWSDLYKKRFNQSYGSFIYDSEYEFANETKTVDIMFTATPLIGYSGEDKVYSTIFKRTGESPLIIEEHIDSNIRIMYTKLVTGVTSWNITGASVTSYTQYPYAGHLNDPDAPTLDLLFGTPKEIFFTLVSGSLNNNLFNVYWSTYMAEITDKDSKLMTATIKLSKKDISNLDFSNLIYVDGSLFRLNKIIDYNANRDDTCTIELLKVINKIY